MTMFVGRLDDDRGAPTRLENLAAEVGISDDELRALLRRLIAERRAGGFVCERAVVPCRSCGGTYEVSERRARAVEAAGTAGVCPTCRIPGPDAASRAWAARIPGERLELLAGAVAALR